MVEDLRYPEDARKLVRSLIHGLEYDAAFAVLGNSLKDIPKPRKQPDFSSGIRFGGEEADVAVQRDAAGLCSRFSLISMVSRFEHFTQLLLLQRRVLEELKTEGTKMTGPKLWEILRSTQKDIRRLSPAQVALQLLVPNPSAELSARTEWLVGICRVRNCLSHRVGIVGFEDVRKPGCGIEDVKDTDTLRVKWLKLKPTADGEEIKEFPYRVEGGASGPVTVHVQPEEYEREWKIGEAIHVTPLECQEIGICLALLGRQMLAEFENEMNQLYLDHKLPPVV